VREAFLLKLRKHLVRKRNAPRWNMVPFLSAHDLDEELHELVGILMQKPTLFRLD
jgi:hypothetical protein